MTKTLSRLHFLARFYHTFSNYIYAPRASGHEEKNKKKKKCPSLTVSVPSRLSLPVVLLLYLCLCLSVYRLTLLLTSSLNCAFLNGPRFAAPQARGHRSKISLDSRTSARDGKGKIEKKKELYI
jgi:hypothetical protein